MLSLIMPVEWDLSSTCILNFEHNIVNDCAEQTFHNFYQRQAVGIIENYLPNVKLLYLKPWLFSATAKHIVQIKVVPLQLQKAAATTL